MDQAFLISLIKSAAKFLVVVVLLILFCSRYEILPFARGVGLWRVNRFTGTVSLCTEGSNGGHVKCIYEND